MFEAVHRGVHHCDVLVMAAAVTDYKPARISKEKIKKDGQNLSLELIATRDILRSLPKADREYLVVGFAAETENIQANARRKLREKNCDLVIANDARIGMESDENEITIWFRDGKKKEFSRALKKIIARELVKIFENVREKCLTKKIT
jgi:phosphopantothenoylcysteine decarboxylase/phosphopantothenate--cysteine ligase